LPQQVLEPFAAAKSDPMSRRFVLVYSAIYGAVYGGVVIFLYWCVQASTPTPAESSVLLPCWTEAISAEPRPGQACCCPSSSR
jgi:hypothetical protein